MIDTFGADGTGTAGAVTVVGFETTVEVGAAENVAAGAAAGPCDEVVATVGVADAPIDCCGGMAATVGTSPQFILSELGRSFQVSGILKLEFGTEPTEWPNDGTCRDSGARSLGGAAKVGSVVPDRR